MFAEIIPPMQAHATATAAAIAVFILTPPPAAAADITTQATGRTDEQSPNKSPFFLIGHTDMNPAISAAAPEQIIETGV